jgi:hypothetical protein
MSEDPRSHLIHAFRKVLRPLVKILIRAGVRHDEFVEVIKGVYVESAIRDGIGRPGPLTRSRVSLATGVPRRDVDRYVDNEDLLTPPPPTHAATLTEVLHLWNTDPKYLGPYGVPLEIDFDATPGRSFMDLVMRANPDANAVLLLEDLTRSRVVVQSGEKFLKVTSRTYVTPEPMSDVSIEYFGNTLANLANTLDFNLSNASPFNSGDGDKSGKPAARTASTSDFASTSVQSPSAADLNVPKRLERAVFADNGLDPDQLVEFDRYARERVQHLISDIDDWLAKRGPRDPESPDIVSTGIGIFHYVNAAKQQRSLKDLAD